MYPNRTINDALRDTILAARGQASTPRPPAVYWQDFFIEEGIFSYDLITAGLKPGVADDHWTQCEERLREKVAEQKGDHHSHASDHERGIQRDLRAEMARFAFHTLTVVYDVKQRKFARQVDWYKARLQAAWRQRYDMNQLMKNQRFISSHIRTSMYSGSSPQWHQRGPGRR